MLAQNQYQVEGDARDSVCARATNAAADDAAADDADANADVAAAHPACRVLWLCARMDAPRRARWLTSFSPFPEALRKAFLWWGWGKKKSFFLLFFSFSHKSTISGRRWSSAKTNIR